MSGERLPSTRHAHYDPSHKQRRSQSGAPGVHGSDPNHHPPYAHLQTYSSTPSAPPTVGPWQTVGNASHDSRHGAPQDPRPITAPQSHSAFSQGNDVPMVFKDKYSTRPMAVPGTRNPHSGGYQAPQGQSPPRPVRNDARFETPGYDSRGAQMRYEGAHDEGQPRVPVSHYDGNVVSAWLDEVLAGAPLNPRKRDNH